MGAQPPPPPILSPITTSQGLLTPAWSQWFVQTLYAQVKSGLVTVDMIEAALGYVPYDKANPNKFISGISQFLVDQALGYTPEPALGNPTIDGMALISTALGKRSWGSAGGSTFQIWDPDLAPASPSAYNDEFNGGPGLNPKWTGVNLAGLTGGGYDVNTTVPDSLYMYATSGLSATIPSILQAPPAGDFTIYLKGAAINPNTTGDSNICLILTNGVTQGAGNQVVCYMEKAGNIFYFGANYWTLFTTQSTTAQAMISPVWCPYIRIRRVGTTYYFECSPDGKTWYGSVGTTLTFTPSYMGLCFFGSSGPRTSESFEFFRYYPSATAQLGGYRTYRGA